MRLHGDERVRRSMLEVLERIIEPVVLIQETLAVARPDSCVVRQDDRGGGTLLAEHLIVRGVQRLAVVVPEFSGPMTGARLAGLREGYANAGVAVEIDVVRSKINDFANAYDTVVGYLRAGPRPQAIVGTNDELALAALRALQDLGVEVPDAVRVVGFNGFQPPGDTRPSLSTIVSAANAIGEQAGKVMLSRLQSGAFGQSEIVLPVSFRKGGST
jgi:DNA-binding LacI/PurR family transcriptional regulator